MITTLLALAGIALGAPGQGACDECDDAPTLDEDEVELAPPFDRKQHRFLRPKRASMGPAPRGQTDFTAYTLEWGEVRVGVGSITVGVLPRTQVGTSPMLDLIGLYNGHFKFNAVRLGGLDLAVNGSGYLLPLGDFLGAYYGGGASASLRVVRGWSVHGGVDYSLLHFQGIPDLSQASPLLFKATGEDPADWVLDPQGVLDGIEPAMTADAVWANASTDVRFNRRDSLVLQASALLWARVRTDLGMDWDELNLPPIAGLDEALEYEGAVPLSAMYMVTLSYQASWKQVDLRLGIGISSLPYAWVLQSVDLAYRFGGHTRRTEARTKRGWRRSRQDIGPFARDADDD